MRTTRLLPWIAALFWLFTSGAQAAQPCGVNGWNLTHEQALFAGTPTVAHAGKNAATAPMIATDRLYRLTLAPQSEVTFVVAPGKMALTDGSYAGIARFTVPSGGSYRIAIDQKFWIDVVHAGKVIKSGDFTGERGCTPHKIVAYMLPRGTLLVQVSGQVSPQVGISITRAPTAGTH